jgi:hypothetical protein
MDALLQSMSTHAVRSKTDGFQLFCLLWARMAKDGPGIL